MESYSADTLLPEYFLDELHQISECLLIVDVYSRQALEQR